MRRGSPAPGLGFALAVAVLALFSVARTFGVLGPPAESIGLLVGALAKTQEAATAIVNLIVLPMAFLGGAFIPLAFAPQWIVKVSYFMPLRYLVVGAQNVMARGDGPASALPAMGILLGFATVLTVIAVRVFRWDEI